MAQMDRIDHIHHGHEITGDSNDYTTVDDNLVTAEPRTDQAINSLTLSGVLNLMK